MIAGNDSHACFQDMKYNMEHDDFIKLASIKKALASEEMREMVKSKELGKFTQGYYNAKLAKEKLESVILPSVYNKLNGFETQSAFHKTNKEEDDEALKNIALKSDIMAESGKYEEGTILKKTINSMYNEYKNIIEFPPSDEEVEQEEKTVSRNTCADEDSHEHQDHEDNNPLAKMDGYKQLEEWLKKMKCTDKSKKKKFRQMSKVSDLQKVSVVEFIKPKALFMKKIVNKELYLKQVIEGERFMHIIIDRSGSMGGYHNWRNALVNKTYEDCVKMNISVENSFWNSHLYKDGPFSPQRIRSKADLESKVFNIDEDDEDNMGRCTLEKVRSLTKEKVKQYILVISDGTGSIYDTEQRKTIFSEAESKNIEIKFALFSHENNMQGTKKEDIFYIYK
jgi:hypothetical protein